MYISSIELRNIGPYQSVRKTFTRGLVGIVGPNGAGKSTLLKSCYAAITGDFSRFRGGRNSAIRLGSPDTEPAYITVTGEHHGHEFTITRGLRRMSRQTLTLGGETYTEAKEVQRAMEDLVGVPMAILENYVFMRQGKLTELFELTDTARAKLFHNLCDTEIAETIWRCLGTRIGVLDKDLRTRTLPDLEGMHARIRELRRQISDAESRMARVESAKLPRERRDLLRDLAQAYAQTAGDPQRRERLLQDREQQQRLLRERADRVEKLRLASENLQALVSEGQRNSLAAREALLAWRTYDQWLSQVQEVQDRIAQRKRDLDACRPPRAPKRATTEGKAEVLREIAAVQARLERAQQLRDLLADQHSVDCQACGAPVHKLVDMRDEAVRDLRELPERLQKLREERDAITAYERERDAHERRVANLQAKLRADEGLLQSLGTLPEPDIPKAEALAASKRVQALQAQQDQLAAEIRAAERALSEARSTLAQTEDSLQLIARRRKRYLELREQAGMSGKQAQKALQEHAEAVEAYRHLQGLVLSARQQLKAERERLAQAKAESAERVALESCAQFLERLRDVFHRDNLPRRLATRKLRQLEGRINQTLEDFGSPFRVETQEDLSFLCHFAGQSPRPDALLSGGQQTILAMALLRAVNLMYAGRVGLLALDEPSENLDKDNVVYLRTALERFAHEADRAKAQVFLVTHQDSLASAFTSTVSLAE